ncbi:MAG: site-specific integrase [Nitrosomonadales bacterium]
MAVIRNYTDKKGVMSFQAIVRKKGHKPLSKMFSKEADAIKWAKGVEVDIERHVFIDTKEASVTTLADALDRYEEVAKKNKGYSMEKYRIDVWRRHDLANRSIVSLRTKDFDDYRDKRREEGMSDATIRNDFAVIAAIFKHFDYGMSSPTIKTTKTLATAKKRSRRLTKQEEEYLLAELDDTNCSDPKRTNKWIPLVTRFAIETAARLSEIVGKDKTADEAAVPGLVWENVQIQKCICKLIDTKNGESRFVPLSPAAIECLAQAQKLSPEKRGPVFPTTNSAIKQSWQRAKKRAQSLYKARGGTDPDFLVDFRFHDNRHEAASRWARDFDQTKLKMITGHKDTRSLDRYINANEEDVAMIAAKMAEVQNTKAS